MNSGGSLVSVVGGIVCVIAMGTGWIVALLKFLLSPLAIPQKARIEREREQNLLAGILLQVFGGVFGIVLVLALMVAAFFQQYNQMKHPQPSTHRQANAPLFPRVSLGELLCMVLGIASYPILIFGTDFNREKGAAVILAMVLGALIYPLCVLAAYNRANANHVPVCGARTLYIALFPLMLFACVFQPLTLLILQQSGLNELPFVQLGLGALAIFVETLAGWRAKCAARDATLVRETAGT
ncbi:MAG TPA: hypothetical protein VKX17_20165 [Planctomycetota bacterium]|nr:hypothetical protein [Planctomycetota bacterium]